MKSFRTASIFALLILTALTSAIALRTDWNRRETKKELIELSNIKYGLFNVDEWQKIVAGLLSRKIEGFEVNEVNRRELKSKISDFLSKVIGDLELRFREQNASTLTGMFKNGVAGVTGTFERIKKDIPVFSGQIIEFLDNPENKRAVRSLLVSKIGEYAKANLEQVDYTVRDSILKKHGVTDSTAAFAVLSHDLERHQVVLGWCQWVLTGLALVSGLLMASSVPFCRKEMLLLVGICCAFLSLGLLLPMIEIDARISEMTIELFGERTEFKNQVLYYKSKSVLEVVWLMVAQGKPGLCGVGLLIFSFSVLFPLSKLAATVLVQFNEDLKTRRAVQWIVKDSGKWSMADVMVVAIFMANTGFSGILSEQLHQLDKLGPRFEVLTTNQSSLQTGFFAFTGFVLLSMFVTSKLSWPPAKRG